MLQVERRAISGIKGQYMGFEGDKVVLIVNDSKNTYTTQEFRRMFKFTDESNQEIYEQQKEEYMSFQVTPEEVDDVLLEAIELNKLAEQEQKDKLKLVQQKKHHENNCVKKQNQRQTQVKPISIGQKLKDKYLNEILPSQTFYNKVKCITCKDGTLSYRYRDVTVFQIKGKRVVYFLFTGKMFDEEHIQNFSLKPKQYRHTHNAYTCLTSEDQFKLINDSIQISMDFVDMKKGEEEQNEA